MDFGWKKKAERLRMVILSGGHQIAKELPPGISRVLEIFRRTAQTGDGSTLQEELDGTAPAPDAERPLWEPIEVHGWKIEATLYLQSGQLWWLLTARRRNEKAPSANDVAFLNKVLDHLGADPKRDMIIGPTSSPAGDPALPFGWWTWFNTAPLYEVQVKGKGSHAMVRVVLLGTRESDGYVRVDLTKDSQSS